MNILALKQARTAIYTRLIGDGVLMSMLADAFDGVVERRAFPYLLIGDGEMEPLPGSDTLGAEVRLSVHVFSQKPTDKELLVILDRAYHLLHHAGFMLEESLLLSVRVLETRTAVQNSQKILEGQLQLRLIISETEAV